MDDDGIDVGQRVPIKVQGRGQGRRHDRRPVRRLASRCRASTTPASPRAARAARWRSSASTSPLDLPINDGQFRALDIVLPPGRVVSAVKPGADAHVDDLSDDDRRHDLQGAGAGHADQVIAGHHADLVVGRINGRTAEGRELLHLSRRADRRRLGRQAQQRRHATRDHRDERRRHPQRPARAGRGQVSAAGRALCACAPDSGGAGRYRGGLGTEQVVQARHPIRFSSQMERVRCKPWGLSGGLLRLRQRGGVAPLPARPRRRISRTARR